MRPLRLAGTDSRPTGQLAPDLEVPKIRRKKRVLKSSASAAEGHRLDLSIAVPFGYPVHFCHGLFAAESSCLREFLLASPRPPHRCLVFVDSGLASAQPDLIARIEAYADTHADLLRLEHPPLVLPGGEVCKNNFDSVLKVIRLARQVHLCRHSYVMAIGGGALLDTVGFAASLIHRGVRLIRVPTTVLSQNDSGVGVKNGVNLRGMKNFLGTFAPPAVVFNDFDMLESLPAREWTGGIAEAFKVAAIKDREFWQWLLEKADALSQHERKAMETLIMRCAELHVEHIAGSGDPFEFGSARPLDFGHWAAHKIESLSLHELRHGEAVAIGICLDLLYAAALGFIPVAEAEQTIGAMARAGLPVWDDVLAVTDPAGNCLVLHGIEEFREHLGGELHVTLPQPIGRKTEVTEIDRGLVAECVKRLHAMNTKLGQPATATRFA
jgi:3-dehydroquinate synthase